jgi:hypothetical protein
MKKKLNEQIEFSKEIKKYLISYYKNNEISPDQLLFNYSIKLVKTFIFF